MGVFEQLQAWGKREYIDYEIPIENLSHHFRNELHLVMILYDTRREKNSSLNI